MGQGFPNTREPKVRAFHEAVTIALTEKNLMGEVISVPEWTRMVVQGMGAMSRQTVQDITFVMESLSLIERRKRDGVIVLRVDPEPDEPLEDNPEPVFLAGLH